MIHTGVVVEHDCLVEEYVNLAPKVVLAGHVAVRKGATIYSNATVIPCIEVGAHSIVGAGAVVTKSGYRYCRDFS